MIVLKESVTHGDFHNSLDDSSRFRFDMEDGAKENVV